MLFDVRKLNGINKCGRRALYLLLPLIVAAGSVNSSAQTSTPVQSHHAVSNKEENLEVVLIDSFVVPEESKEAFLQRVRHSAEILRKLPGFVEGHVYTKTGGESEVNIATTAVWKDQEAVDNAKKVMAEEYRKLGTNPAEIMKSLRVQASRSLYSRSPY